jgi:hypothetical protein
LPAPIRLFNMIKKILLLAAIAASFTFGAALQAEAGLRIELGDRPYYSHGPRYWAGEYEMIWIPGHWSEHGHHWIHGHYRRGEHRHWNHRRDRDDVRADIRLEERR